MAAALLPLTHPSEAMTLFELHQDRNPEAAQAGKIERPTPDSPVIRALMELEGEVDLALVSSGRTGSGVSRSLLSGTGPLPERLELEVDVQEGFFHRGAVTEDTMSQFHADFRRGVAPR